MKKSLQLKKPMLLRPPKSIRKIKFSTLKSGATGVLSMSYRMFRALLTNFNIWHSGVEKAPPEAVEKQLDFSTTVAAAVFGAQLRFESLQREIFVFSDTDILWGCQGFHLSLCHSSFSSCCSLLRFFFSQSFFFLFPSLCLARSPSVSVFVSQICKTKAFWSQDCLNGLYLSLSAADRGTLPPLWLPKQNYVAQNYIKYMKRCHVSLSSSVVTLMAATIPKFIHGLFTTNAALTAQWTMNNPKSGTKLWHILLTLNNVTDGYLCIFMESYHTDAKFQAIKSLWPYCDDIKCATGHAIKLHASRLCCINVL